jgi:hypothetical protein
MISLSHKPLTKQITDKGDEHPCPQKEFELVNRATQRLHVYALDRTATGIEVIGI